MPKFSYEALDSLEYDFRTCPRDSDNGSKGYCEGHGFVPEPSTKSIQRFQDGLQEVLKKQGISPGTEPDLQTIAQAANNPEEQEKALREVAEIVADLCQNQPSADEIMQLPFRVRNAFTKWIRQELTDPNVSGVGTRR